MPAAAREVPLSCRTTIEEQDGFAGRQFSCDGKADHAAADNDDIVHS